MVTVSVKILGLIKFHWASLRSSRLLLWTLLFAWQTHTCLSWNYISMNMSCVSLQTALWSSFKGSKWPTSDRHTQAHPGARSQWGVHVCSAGAVWCQEVSFHFVTSDLLKQLWKHDCLSSFVLLALHAGTNGCSGTQRWDVHAHMCAHACVRVFV